MYVCISKLHVPGSGGGGVEGHPAAAGDLLLRAAGRAGGGREGGRQEHRHQVGRANRSV